MTAAWSGSGYWLDVSEAQARAVALAECARAAEQAALAKSHFLATMSHQIRTPMIPCWASWSDCCQ